LSSARDQYITVSVRGYQLAGLPTALLSRQAFLMKPGVPGSELYRHVSGNFLKHYRQVAPQEALNNNLLAAPMPQIAACEAT
jgi:hypothetical protein